MTMHPELFEDFAKISSRNPAAGLAGTATGFAIAAIQRDALRITLAPSLIGLADLFAVCLIISRALSVDRIAIREVVGSLKLANVIEIGKSVLARHALLTLTHVFVVAVLFGHLRQNAFAIPRVIRPAVS